MPQPNRNRPSLTRLGTVTDDGTTVRVTGWGLALCATSCDCHRHPETGQLDIAQLDNGDLGLASYGKPCDCCQAWTAAELQSVLRDVDVATRLITQPSA